MTININDNIEEKVLAIDARIESLEDVNQDFTLTQLALPNQLDWETAWVAAGNTLPIPTEQTLIWRDPIQIRGEYSTLKDNFFKLYSGIHPLTYSGFQPDMRGISSDGRYVYGYFPNVSTNPHQVNPMRIYLDGTREESADIGWATFAVLYHYSHITDYAYVINFSSEIQNIDSQSAWAATTMLTITGTHDNVRFIVEPNGDTYFVARQNGDTNDRIWLWDESGGSSSVFTTQITINGVATDVHRDTRRVIASTANYVVVETDVQGYWIGLAKAGLAEQTIKSNPAGATAATLPAITNATGWEQVFVRSDYDNDLIYLIYANIDYTGDVINIPDYDWQITIEWDLVNETYTIVDGLPYQAIIDAIVSYKGSDFTYDDLFSDNYAQENAIHLEIYHQSNQLNNLHLTPSYPFISFSETGFLLHAFSGSADGITGHVDYDLLYYNRDIEASSGKVWRISPYGSDYGDCVFLGDINIYQPVNLGYGRSFTLDISNRPEGYDLIEIIWESAKGVVSLPSFSIGNGSSPSNGRLVASAVTNAAGPTNRTVVDTSIVPQVSSNGSTDLGGVSRLWVMCDTHEGGSDRLIALGESVFHSTNSSFEILAHSQDLGSSDRVDTLTVNPGHVSYGEVLTVRAWKTEGRMRNIREGWYGSSLG